MLQIITIEPKSYFLPELKIKMFILYKLIWKQFSFLKKKKILKRIQRAIRVKIECKNQ